MWVYRQIGSIRISIELLAGASPYRLLVKGARLRSTACPHADKVQLGSDQQPDSNVDTKAHRRTVPAPWPQS